MNKKIISSLFAAFVAAATASLAQEAQEIPQATGKIIYVDTTEQNKNYIASMNADGSEKQRLTPAFYNLAFPRYCKKNGLIGFTSRVPSKDKKKFDFEIYTIKKNKVIKALIGASLEDFSPDGEKLIYIKTDGNSELFVYNIKDKKAYKISGNYKVVSARWSDDNDWIAATVLTDDNTTDIVLISTKAEGFKRLTSSANVNDAFPEFIDGLSVIFSSDENEKKEYQIDVMPIYMPDVRYKTNIKGVFPYMSPDKDWFTYENDGNIMIAHKTGYKTKLAKGRSPIWIESVKK